MKKTYTGSCHCRRVTFEADIDLGQGTTKCNCTLCWKRRWWGVYVKPDAFRSLTGEADLVASDDGGSGAGGFCRHCGVVAYSRGAAAEWNDGEYVAINLASLDDLPPDELVAAPLRYLDGRADTWETPAETRHL